MSWLMLTLAAAWLLAALRDLRAVIGLQPLPAADGAMQPPGATIVLPVRDDAAELPGAVRAWTGQQGVDVRLIVVDDRSRDMTPAVLDQLESTEPRLRTVRIRELPTGWTGKSHALHRGTRDVDTEWLLFTDSDAVPAPDLLRRAIDGARRHGADHVVVLPQHRDTTFMGRACLLAFHQVVQHRLGLLRGRRQRTFVGVGAFNLLRASAYRAVGGYDRLRLEIVDDVFLGYLLYRAGYRSVAFFGPDHLSIDWGRTPLALLRVVEKNMFAALRFRSWIAVPLASLAAALIVLPPLAAVAGWPYGPTALLAMACGAVPGAVLAHRMHWSLWAGVLVPLTRGWLVVALLRSTIVTLARGGVRWRDSHYPLAELRRGAVRG